MIRRVIRLPKYEWSIVCFIGYQSPDADDICHALSDIGCNGNPLSEAYEHLHVAAHICEQDGIDMMSEEPCYIMGSLCERFFQAVHNKKR